MRYQVVNGTSYHAETPRDLIEVLEQARLNGTRIRLDYGDVETGRSWGETCDVRGRLSRSMGPVNVPILLANSRSRGGGQILDHCVIGVYLSRGGECLWRLPPRGLSGEAVANGLRAIAAERFRK